MEHTICYFTPSLVLGGGIAGANKLLQTWAGEVVVPGNKP